MVTKNDGDGVFLVRPIFILLQAFVIYYEQSRAAKFAKSDCENINTVFSYHATKKIHAKMTHEEKTLKLLFIFSPLQPISFSLFLSLSPTLPVYFSRLK